MSRSKAIDAFCKECTYDPQEKGSWRAQVEACEMTDCPLWNYRPMTVATKNAQAQKRKADVIVSDAA